MTATSRSKDVRRNAFFKMISVIREYRIEINSSVAERELLQNKILFVSSTDDGRKRHKKEQTNSELKMRIDILDLYIANLRKAYITYSERCYKDLRKTEGEEMAKVFYAYLFQSKCGDPAEVMKIANTDYYHWKCVDDLVNLGLDYRRYEKNSQG